MRFTGVKHAMGICSVLLVATAAAVLTGCSSGPVPQAAPVAAPPSPAPSSQVGRPYHSPDGYSINPPSGWVLHPTSPGSGISVLFAADTVDPAAQKPFVDNLNVVITPTDKTVESLAAETKAKYPSILTNYKSVTDQATTMPTGQAGYLLGGTFDAEGYGSEENIQLLIVNAGKLYTATFTTATGSFDGHHDLFQASLASLVVG